MEFSEFINDSWASQYINYRELKSCVEEIIEIPTQKTEDRFVSLVRENYKQCNKFFAERVEEVKKDLEGTDIDTETLMNKTTSLYNYSLINRLLFYKILKKHDMVSKLKMLPYYSVKLHSSTFCPINDVYYLFSIVSKQKLRDREKMFEKIDPRRRYKYLETVPPTEIYEQIRQNIKIDETDLQKESFQRKSEKYWIVPTHIPAIMKKVAEYIPMFFFDDKIALSTTSVYLDNEEFKSFYDRQSKKESASLIRIRWYGEYDQIDNVFVEKKEHHEDWNVDKSSKKRFMLKKDQIEKFLTSNSFQYDESMGDLDLIKDVKLMIHSEKMRPVLATKYVRFAFQDEKNDFIRISIDTNLRMIKKSGSFRGWADCDNYIDVDNTHLFPFGVMEIKLREPFIENQPGWIDELRQAKGVIPCQDFSKYAHGASILYKDLDEPEWVVINRDMFDKSDVIEELNDFKRVVTISTPYKRVIKIDPKFILQNERALLGWIGMGISMSRSMHNRAHFLRIISGVTGLITIATGVYQYHKRIGQLKDGKTDSFDAYSGIIGLSVLSSIFVVVNICV